MNLVRHFQFSKVRDDARSLFSRICWRGQEASSVRPGPRSTARSISRTHRRLRLDAHQRLRRAPAQDGLDEAVGHARPQPGHILHNTSCGQPIWHLPHTDTRKRHSPSIFALRTAAIPALTPRQFPIPSIKSERDRLTALTVVYKRLHAVDAACAIWLLRHVCGGGGAKKYKTLALRSWRFRVAAWGRIWLDYVNMEDYIRGDYAVKVLVRLRTG